MASLKYDKKQIRVDYFAIFNIATSPGVVNKIEQTVNAFDANKFVTNKFIISSRGYKNIKSFFIKLFLSTADSIIIRNTFLMPFLFPILIIKRLQGKEIIIDIPTPNTTGLHELRMSALSPLVTAVRMGVLAISFPWALFPASRVLQYAHESAYFSFGIRRKSQLIANGVDVASIPLRTTTPRWPTENFVMVAAASLAHWHAFDRVIKGMANYLQSSSMQQKINIKLIIVGDGECRQSWENLAEELGIGHCVEFVGFQTGQALTAFFNQAHVAIASLGLFRKGLDMASDLKSREYTARGLPFIAAGEDIDFDPVPSFVFKVENTDMPIDMGSVIDWYDDISKNRSMTVNIRQYAKDKLDYSKKIKQMLDL